MSFPIITAVIALAVPLAAAATNAALHRQRATPQTAGKRQIPAKLSPRGWIDEAIATMLVFVAPIAWALPTPGKNDRRGALAILVEPLWAPASWLLLRRLRTAGWRPVVLLIRPIPRDEGELEHVARDIVERTEIDGPVTLIGIDGAGLVARQLAARDARFDRVVTIAAPHQGTLCRARSKTLRPQSPFVEQVARADPPSRSFEAVALYSDGDAWIEPPTAGYYAGAFNLEIHDVGHFSMLFSKRVFDYVEENLTASPPAASA